MVSCALQWHSGNLSIRLNLNRPFAMNRVNWGHAEGREGAFKDEGWRHVRAVSQQRPRNPMGAFSSGTAQPGNKWTEEKSKRDLVFLQRKSFMTRLRKSWCPSHMEGNVQGFFGIIAE